MNSGIYYMVKRGEKWLTVDMTEMTPNELDEWLWNMTEEELMRTIRVLVEEIRMVDVLDE